MKPNAYTAIQTAVARLRHSNSLPRRVKNVLADELNQVVERFLDLSAAIRVAEAAQKAYDDAVAVHGAGRAKWVTDAWANLVRARDNLRTAHDRTWRP